jgi:hypothetical protein
VQSVVPTTSLINKENIMSEQNQLIETPVITLPNGRVFESRRVGKFLTGRGAAGGVIITADAKPYVNISYHNARAAAKAAELKLIPDSLAAALAYDASQQDINWTGGKVGEGEMFRGLHKWTVRSAQPGTYESADPAERRWLQLSNGERIWDLSGNAYSWTEDDVQGDKDGLIAKPFAADSISICLAPAPSMEKGVGWYPPAGTDWSGLALVRGGCWRSDDDAGAFYLSRDWPVSGSDIVGFRCTE